MDLAAKVEKYEGKAAHCKESARQVAGPQRAMYEVLADYYGKLAKDFRQVIEKRNPALVEPIHPDTKTKISAKEDELAPQDQATGESQIPHDPAGMAIPIEEAGSVS